MSHYFKISQFLIITLSTCLFLNACVLSNNEYKSKQANHISQILLAPPFIADPNFENEEKKLTKVLYSKDIEDMKLKSQVALNLARIKRVLGSYNSAIEHSIFAIKLNPKNAEAYLNLGFLFLEIQNYAKAYEFFDSALELAPSINDIYFVRAITSYYDLRFESSLEDLEKYIVADKDVNVIAFWRYLSEEQVLGHDEAIANLRANYQGIKTTDDDDVIYSKVIEFILGKISEDQVWEYFAKNDIAQKNSKFTCELYYLLGKLYQLEGKLELARNYFILSLQTNSLLQVEYILAKIEVEKIVVNEAKQENKSEILENK